MAYLALRLHRGAAPSRSSAASTHSGDRLQQPQHEDARLQHRVSEACDVEAGAPAAAAAAATRRLAHARMSCSSIESSERKRIPRAHELPDDRERELAVAVGDVLPRDADGAQLEPPRQLERVVAVLGALVDGARLEGDARPVDDARPQLVLDAQQQQPVAAVLGEPVGVQVPAQPERRDPGAELQALALVGLRRRAERHVELGERELLLHLGQPELRTISAPTKSASSRSRGAVTSAGAISNGTPSVAALASIRAARFSCDLSTSAPRSHDAGASWWIITESAVESARSVCRLVTW